jgi:GH25 family lysozyme M1 (1,4-beta-N-acetylmuramidase)
MPRASVAAIALLFAVAFGLVRAEQLSAASRGGPSALTEPPQADGYLEGIDVSHWQGTINWGQVAAAGKSFAMIKVTEGEQFLDWAYAGNIAAARAAGVRATAYHFAQPGLPAEEANIQADWFVQNAGLKAGDMVPALDLEIRNGLSVTDLQAWVLTWLRRVEARLGIKPMIYVSPSFWRTYMGDTRAFADMGYTVLWIAHWGVSSPSLPAESWGGRGWTFWQYSNCGSVPGISGCVDLNRYNGLDLSPVLYGPGKPTGVTGEPGNGLVTVSWIAPAVSTGGPITGYTATASPGGRTCSTSGALSCVVTELTNGTDYTFTVRASNAAGQGLPSSPSAPVRPGPPPPSSYMPLAPARILDTRFGNGLSGALPVGLVRSFQVTGRGGVPVGATAVTGNLTVTGQTNGGWLTVGPSASGVSGVSTLNFPPGDNRANGLTVALGGGGTLSIVYAGAPSGASTQAIFDVTGYYMPGTGGATYFTVSPNRVLDSRYGNGLSGPFQAGIPRTFQVTNRSGDASRNVPATATAVTGNLTVTQQGRGGWLSVTPTAVSNPSTSTLNFPVGDNRANNLTAPLGSGGTLSIVYNGAPAGTTTHAIFDVTGYFVPGASGSLYVPLQPSRLLDSRHGIGLSGRFAMGIARSFGVVNRAAGDAGRNVPSTAVAATGNLTVTGQTRGGWLTITPTPDNQPPTSTLNFPFGDTRANGVTVGLGAGSLSVVYNGATTSDSTDVLFDVTGYFVPAP